MPERTKQFLPVITFTDYYNLIIIKETCKRSPNILEKHSLQFVCVKVGGFLLCVIKAKRTLLTQTNMSMDTVQQRPADVHSLSQHAVVRKLCECLTRQLSQRKPSSSSSAVV